MNAMDFMKALGDIPEELVKNCFDEDIANNSKISSDANSSELSKLATSYQLEKTDDDNNPVSPPKIRSKHIHFSGYIATVAACLAIVIGLPLIISHLIPKSGITPDAPFVPTHSQGETDNSVVTEINTSTTSNKSTTTLTSTTESVHMTSKNITTTKTQAETNVTQSIQQTEEISSETTQIPTHTEQHTEYTQPIPNDNSYNSVITIQMPDELYQKMLDIHMYASRNAETTFYWYNKTYKVEYTQKLSDYVFYSVQKLSSGGLFYAFWQGSDTDNAILSHTAVADRRLSLSDFDGININDTYEKVEQIEPTTRYWIENFRDRRKYQELYKQRIILTDGLLVISYEAENENFIISDLAYYDNYTENVPDIQFPNEKELALDYEYRILLDDYPK